MRMTKLAFLNFKSSIKNYFSLVLSLSFTILVFLNFQNIIYSDSFEILGSRNKDYVDTMLQVVSLVLGCFMFFFIWYATNVFLTRRKKEMGTYVFMGLTNQEIGKLYVIETGFTALAALILGVLLGTVTTGLFQMILLAISDIAVDIQFHFSVKPMAVTAGLYLIIYGIFMLKGYVNIVKSSVLNMISASRQNEYVRQKQGVLFLKAALGLAVLGTGYYLAIKDGGQEVMANALAAVAFVIAGVYLLFGGLLPLVFQGLSQSKAFLYRKQRCLWINNMVCRIKRNYRTYAMVSVLGLCSVTALATSFALKYRYDSIVHFENTYTFQLLSNQPDLNDRARALLEEDNEIVYSSVITMVSLDPAVVEEEEEYAYRGYYMLSYGELKKLAEETGLPFELKEPEDDEYLKAAHLPVLSLNTLFEERRITIAGNSYRQIGETTEPYLGYLQQSLNVYIVNDRVYEMLRPLGGTQYAYNYRIANPDGFAAGKEKIGVLTGNTEENYTARVAIDPYNTDIDWLKVMYSLCIFMFMVFILAGASILFMKLYNDAFEEKSRYRVMRRMGFEEAALKKSIRLEVATAYIMPFAVLAISSYFSVHALEKMMKTNLLSVNVVSILVVLAVFAVFYGLSAAGYIRECLEEQKRK